MIRWTGLASWEFQFHLSDRLTSTFPVRWAGTAVRPGLEIVAFRAESSGFTVASRVYGRVYGRV